MSEELKNEWEREFDKGEYSSVAPHDWNEDNIKGYNHFKEDVKSFISSLLAKQQEEMVEEIKKLADTTPPNLLLNAIVSRY
jgi:hypothetical protein